MGFQRYNGKDRRSKDIKGGVKNETLSVNGKRSTFTFTPTSTGRGKTSSGGSKEYK